MKSNTKSQYYGLVIWNPTDSMVSQSRSLILNPTKNPMGFEIPEKGGPHPSVEHSVDSHVHLLKELHWKAVDGQFQTYIGGVHSHGSTPKWIIWNGLWWKNCLWWKILKKVRWFGGTPIDGWSISWKIHLWWWVRKPSYRVMEVVSLSAWMSGVHMGCWRSRKMVCFSPHRWVTWIMRPRGTQHVQILTTGYTLEMSLQEPLVFEVVWLYPLGNCSTGPTRTGNCWCHVEISGDVAQNGQVSKSFEACHYVKLCKGEGCKTRGGGTLPAGTACGRWRNNNKGLQLSLCVLP